MKNNKKARVQKYVQAVKGVQFAIGFVLGVSIMFFGGKSFLSWSTAAPALDFQEIALVNSAGDSLTFNELGAGNQLIYFWASWHKRCIKDLPELSALCQDLQAKGCDCIVISDESPKIIEQYQANTGKHMRFYHSSKRFVELGLKGLPTYYLFNSQDQVLLSKTGVGHWNRAKNRQAVLELLTF